MAEFGSVWQTLAVNGSVLQSQSVLYSRLQKLYKNETNQNKAAHSAHLRAAFLMFETLERGAAHDC